MKDDVKDGTGVNKDTLVEEEYRKVSLYTISL
jgi:hypothetical protein